MKNIFCCFFLFLIFMFCHVSLTAQTDKYIECSLINTSRLTIEKNPQIMRQVLEVERSIADKTNVQSAFDYQLRSDINYQRGRYDLLPQDPLQAITNNIGSNNGLWRTSLQKTFRSSMTMQTSFEFSRITDSNPFNEFGENIGEYIGNNKASLSLDLVQPLLRGRGREIATANEQAASLQIEANQNNAEFVAANELLNTIRAYWQFLASYRSLEVYRKNEERVNRILDVTRTLIAADKRPSVDSIQVKADLAEKQGQTIQAEQAYIQSKLLLGRTIGLSDLESAALGDPEDDFPNVSNLGATDPDNWQKLADLAVEERTDLQALNQLYEALGTILTFTDNGMKPQLDLIASLGYDGVLRGNGPNRVFSALGEKPGRQMSAGLGISFLFPLQNRAAEASFAQQKIALSDQLIVLENEQRNIRINVQITYNNLLKSMENLERASQALEYYQAAYENETIKFNSGLTTLLNLTIFQERLTFANIQFVQSQLRLANDLANLRFETGTLLKYALDDRRAFYEIPSLNQ